MDWADVVFVAEDKPIAAHRVILTARSEYFSAMFSSGMRESVDGTVEVVVPDSYKCFYRLLAFMYTGTILATSVDVRRARLQCGRRRGVGVT